MVSKKIMTSVMIASVVTIIAVAVVGILLTSNNGREVLPGNESYNSSNFAVSAEINSPEPSAADMQEPLGDLVSDQYSNTGNYSDDINNTYQYSYHVPKINIDSAEADEVNSEINAYCMESINEELLNMKSGCSLVLIDLSYSACVYNDILSIIIKQSLNWADYMAYEVYNVDTHTGKQISNSELLYSANINQDTFINAARGCIADRFKGDFQYFKNQVDEALSLYNDTVYSDNIAINMPMFLDNDGKINIIATIYGVAGDGYEYIINTSLSQRMPIVSTDYAIDPLYPQVIEVLANGSNASITLYDWSDGKWAKEYSCLGCIGVNGITPKKADGDGKTPEGKFALGFVFGLTQPETNLPFKNVEPGTVWVDDFDSEYYNTLQLENASYKDWNSSEDLYSDCQSLICAAITYNFNGDGLGTNGFMNSTTPGGGAALWFNGRYTVRNGTPGDIDINQVDMISILRLLDVNKNPIIDIKEASSGSDYNG